MTHRQDLYDLDRSGLQMLCQSWGFSAFHSEKIWKGLYREGVQSLVALDARPDLKERLLRHARLGHLTKQVELNSDDGFTRKFLLNLADGQTIETVLMRFRGRNSVCVSTQVGCAMGCVFCATGQMGFVRHLTAGEIIAQVLFVNQQLAKTGENLRNLVFMGMGEPLHNYKNTLTAVRILVDHRGLAMAPKHITVSTVGVVPGIDKLASEEVPIRLAVSLHGATNSQRLALIPAAKRWSLTELIDACRRYTKLKKQRVFFEWTLIEGENDTKEQARALGELLKTLPSHVNLIPLNPTVGYAGVPTRSEAVKEFQAILGEFGVPSTVRQRRGIDIGAGCGQLKAQPCS